MKKVIIFSKYITSKKLNTIIHNKNGKHETDELT